MLAQASPSELEASTEYMPYHGGRRKAGPSCWGKKWCEDFAARWLSAILLKSPHYLVCACIIMHRNAQAADLLFAYRLHGWLFLSFLRLTIKYDAKVIEPIWSSWPPPLHHHQDRLYHLWDRTRSRTSGHSGVKVGMDSVYSTHLFPLLNNVLVELLPMLKGNSQGVMIRLQNKMHGASRRQQVNILSIWAHPSKKHRFNAADQPMRTFTFGKVSS